MPTHRPEADTAYWEDRQDMTIQSDLNIAEIPHESGAVRLRYARVLASDGARWIRHGLFVEYSPDGTVLSEGHYLNGKENGPWRDYHPNGKVASEGSYLEGREVGIWRIWNAEGVAEKSTDYGS